MQAASLTPHSPCPSTLAGALGAEDVQEPIQVAELSAELALQRQKSRCPVVLGSGDCSACIKRASVVNCRRWLC